MAEPRPLVALLSLGIYGCSSEPSSSTLEKAFNDYAYVNAESGIFKIKNVQKTNAYQLDDVYTVEISFERHFLIGIDEAIEELRKEAAKRKSWNSMEGMQWKLLENMTSSGMARLGLVNQWGEFSRGSVQNMTHEISFIETENGWQTYD